MINYIKTNYTGDKLILLQSTAEMLNQFEPKGCPFPNYTYLSLVKDLVAMYSWRIDTDTSLIDFITMLMKCEAHAQAYGSDIINILRCFE